MPLKVLHKGTLGTLPLLDTARAARCKGKFGRVGCEGADALFVVGEDTHCFSCGEIPCGYELVR